MMKVLTYFISILGAAKAFAPNAFVKNSRTRRNMFTGIVEEMGTVKSLEQRDDMVLWYVRACVNNTVYIFFLYQIHLVSLREVENI